jgi:transposase
MNIFEAYDLTGSFRDAGELAGCSHHTVARYVRAREAGCLSAAASPRPRLVDGYLPKIEEWMESSKGKIRADKAHEKLLGMGFTGSPRTTRRAVARVRRNYRMGLLRVHRPWVTEPGMWVQYDFGDGPMIGGAKTTLFCAWVAWSRFRVVLALRDKTAASVYAALDVTFRRLGGVPTYLLTDNEKTVTVAHVAGIPVRNPGVVAWARHYGVTVATCEPADPASKGGSESTVKLAKADLVPTATNLLDAYESFEALEAACEAFCEQVNGRVHRITRRRPVDMLAEERVRLHPVPDVPATAAFGVTRRVPATTPMVAFDNGQYSVPHRLLGQTVWVRVRGAGTGEQVVIVHVGPGGPVEVARHDRAAPGSPRIDDAHFPPAPAGALGRAPRPRTAAETAFCAIGDGARLWLVEAAAAGATKIGRKMAQAVELSKLFGAEQVDWALGHAAVHARFAEADLASILDHAAGGPTGQPRLRAPEDGSLAQGTTAWAAFGAQDGPR